MNLKSDLVSIIIPLYNVEKFILETLLSIKNQSYTNFEVILYDDASTDNTAEIVHVFCKDDARFRLYKNERNLQIAQTLNNCLKIAKGNFIARCDGDDLMQEDRLKTQLEYLKKYKEIGLVGNSYFTINEDSEVISKYIYPSGFALLKKLAKYKPPVSHIWMARRTVYDTVGAYRLSSVEDYDFLLRCIKHGIEFDNISDYFGMFIRIRSGNTVSKFGLVQRILFNYALKIHKGKRSYSVEVEKNLKRKYLKSIWFSIHYISDNLSNIGGSSKNTLKKMFFHFLSLLISPYKFQYFYRATIYAIKIKLNG